MVLVLGMFLINALCAFVPCQRFYDPPVPVPPDKDKFSQQILNPNIGQPFHNFIQDDPNPFRNLANNSANKNNYYANHRYFDPIENPVVETKSGFVRGYRMQTIRARRIYSFTAIPYAEPPIGQLRYRAPVPKKGWSGIYDATKTAPHCLQISALQQLRIIGSENCLFLNVHTPKLPEQGQKEPKIPVLIFIHGGSFAFSSGSIFGPSYLLDRDVILVTLNYRLSSLGFLSTGDDEASGNWGLKDQNLALRWVHKNIGFFGGDNSRITLFGQSAGAVSVHLHMLSKLSRGLFHRAISESGSSFCFWAVRQDSVDYTYRLAARLRCPVNDSRLTVECLRRTDAHLIAYHEATLPEFTLFPGVFFSPVVEFPGPGAFLDDLPSALYARKEVAPVPWISGFLSVEGNGLAFLTYLYPRVIQEVDSRWNELAHLVLDIRREGNVRLVSKAVAAIRKYYVGDSPISFYTRRRLADMYGDRLITTGVHRGLQYHSTIAPTYGYFFNYSGRYSTADSFGLSNVDWGISHDDDLIYLMNSTTYQALKVGDPEYEMSEFLVNVWTNFAATGKPTYTVEGNESGREEDFDFWAPVKNASNVQLVRLDGDFPVMISQPYLDRVKFWENLGLTSDSSVDGPFTDSVPTRIQNHARPHTFSPFPLKTSNHNNSPIKFSSGYRQP